MGILWGINLSHKEGGGRGVVNTEILIVHIVFLLLWPSSFSLQPQHHLLSYLFPFHSPPLFTLDKPNTPPFTPFIKYSESLALGQMPPPSLPGRQPADRARGSLRGTEGGGYKEQVGLLKCREGRFSQCAPAQNEFVLLVNGLRKVLFSLMVISSKT